MPLVTFWRVPYLDEPFRTSIAPSTPSTSTVRQHLHTSQSVVCRHRLMHSMHRPTSFHLLSSCERSRQTIPRELAMSPSEPEDTRPDYLTAYSADSSLISPGIHHIKTWRM